MKKRSYACKPKTRTSYKKRKTNPSGVVATRSFAAYGKRLGNPLGPIIKGSFRLAANGTINGGASGAIATFTLLLNSLFDPFGSSGTDQPRGFDQLSPLYGKYRVRANYLTLKFANNTANTAALGGASIVGMYVSDTSTAPTTSRDAIENGYCVWDLLPSGAEAKTTLTLKVDMAKFKGRPVTDDEMGAAVNANPADLCYLHIFVIAADGSTDLNPHAYQFTSDFYADLFDPVTVAAS